MMKNRFLAAVMAVLAGLAVVSCEDIEKVVDDILEVSLSAVNGEFNEKGEATLTLSLNAISYKDVTVKLGSKPTEVEEGYQAIVDPEVLLFDESVTIPAKTQSVSVNVKVVPEAVEPGQEAVITIVYVDGATVGKNATAYVKVPARGYSEGDNGNGNGNGEGNGNDEEGVVLKKDWSVKVIGEPYYYEGDAYFDVEVTAPGITYFWLDTFTDEELQEMSQGSVKNMLDTYSESIKKYLDDYSIADVVFSMDDDEFYVSYYDAGPTKVYIMEFDQNGNPTYNYGVTEIVLPEIEGGEEDPESDLVVSYHNDWTGYYEGRIGVDPLNADVVTVTKCNAKYFYAECYPAGMLEEYADELGTLIEDAAFLPMLYTAFGATMDDLVEYGIVGASVPAQFSTDLEAGAYECIIVALDEDAYPTGDYGYFTFDAPGPDYPDLVKKDNWGAYFAGSYYDEDYEEDLSVITITGLAAGEYVSVSDFGEIGDFSDLGYEELQEEVYNVAGECISDYLYYYEDGETLADYAWTAEDNDVLFYALDEEDYGDYELLLAGISEDLKITGEYAIVTVTVDGTQKAAAKVKSIKWGNVSKNTHSVLPRISKDQAQIARQAAKAGKAAKKAQRKSLQVVR